MEHEGRAVHDGAVGGEMMVNEMIERAARAMCLVDGVDPDAIVYSGQPYYVLGQRYYKPVSEGMPAWMTFVRYVRPAIEALRKPTEAMMEAVDCGGEKRSWLSGKAWETGYKTMIDAILKE